MIIDGVKLSEEILTSCQKQVEKFPYKVTLTVVTIGNNDASEVYVRNKKKAAESVGILFEHLQFSENDTYDKILDEVVTRNWMRDDIRGIILQLPIVSNVLTDEEKKMLSRVVSFEKDVDGFQEQSSYTPCTPKGVMYMLDSIKGLELKGKTALVIGRSDIVGKPLAKLLLDRDCTVIQAHSKTPKEMLCRMFSISDIVVSAVGKPDVISFEDSTQYWKDNRHDYYGSFTSKPHRVIIDVGINRDSNGKLCGDFSEDFKRSFSEYYSPVPKGVGPMTVAMLMDNTVQSAKRYFNYNI